MASLDERVAVLETKMKLQEEKANDQEERLRVVEDLKGVVVTLKDTAEKQGENIDKLSDAITAINNEKAKAEGIINIAKNIKPKDIIMFIMALIILASMVTGVKINTESVREVKSIVNELEEGALIEDSSNVTE